MRGELYNSFWLIDSGTSHHVAGNVDLLSNVHDMIECPVGLPNGKHTPSTKQDGVRLSNNFFLRNV